MLRNIATLVFCLLIAVMIALAFPQRSEYLALVVSAVVLGVLTPRRAWLFGVILGITYGCLMLLLTAVVMQGFVHGYGVDQGKVSHLYLYKALSIAMLAVVGAVAAGLSATARKHLPLYHPDGEVAAPKS
jgi:hypothetical protein